MNLPGNPHRDRPGVRTVQACSDAYYALRELGWTVEPPKDVTDARRIMLPPSAAKGG